MGKKVVMLGGALNAIFTLFHVYLGYRIHQFQDIAPGYRGLMEMLNAGGVIVIGLFAYVSLSAAQELLETKVGRAVLWGSFLTYAWRAVEEFTIASRVSPVILVACLLVAAVYMTAIILAGQTKTSRA